MKLLIAYDGSECADEALTDLHRAGLPEDVEAQIVCVAEVWLPPSAEPGTKTAWDSFADNPSYAKSVAALKQAQRFADLGKDRLAANFPGWKISSSARSGSAAWELVFMADDWKPDLLLVGSQGQTALSRVLLGSVSQRVLAEAKCSVRIARGKQEEPGALNGPVKIVVGVDGSPGSEIAVKEVARRVWSDGSEVRLVMFDDPFVPAFVSELIAPLSSTSDDSDVEEQSWANTVLASSAALLNQNGIKVTTESRTGNPKNELPHAAEEWGADCIFVGSTGFSNRFERFVLGSVSAAVAARAHCSVEIVRHGGEPNTGGGS